MGCFAVSAIGAIGVGVARHIVKHHEKKLALEHKEQVPEKFGSDIKWSTKLAYLELTLGSGSLILLGEHIFHGEVVPYPPFFTAMEHAEDTRQMFYEIGTVGVAMFFLLIIAWAVGILIADAVKYRKRKTSEVVETEGGK